MAFVRYAKFVITAVLLVPTAGTSQQTHTYVGHFSEPFPGAQAFKEPTSGILVYVESDGRHMAAITPQGKLLWNRDPFTDSKLEFYRFEKPRVIYIGANSDKDAPRNSHDTFVVVTLANSQFGLINLKNGAFTFGGQD